MNKSDLKTILYIIIGVLVIGTFLRILPYLIIVGFIVYGVLKIFRYIKDKKDGVRVQKDSNYTSNSGSAIHMEDEVDTSEAIDVDFKDV